MRFPLTTCLRKSHSPYRYYSPETACRTSDRNPAATYLRLPSSSCPKTEFRRPKPEESTKASLSTYRQQKDCRTALILHPSWKPYQANIKWQTKLACAMAPIRLSFNPCQKTRFCKHATCFKYLTAMCSYSPNENSRISERYQKTKTIVFAVPAK